MRRTWMVVGGLMLWLVAPGEGQRVTVRRQVETAVRVSVAAAVDGAVSRSVVTAVETSVRASVATAVDVAVRQGVSALEGSLRTSIGTAVERAVREAGGERESYYPEMRRNAGTLERARIRALKRAWRSALREALETGDGTEADALAAELEETALEAPGRRMQRDCSCPALMRERIRAQTPTRKVFLVSPALP